jgi:hypothetical protein
VIVDADAMSVDPPVEAPAGTEEQSAQTPLCRRSTRTRA